MRDKKYSMILVFFIFIAIAISMIAIMTENVYEPEIEMINIDNIEKSTSGITDVWPFKTMIITLDPDEFNDTANEGIIKLSLPDNELELHLAEQSITEEQRKIKIINESGIFILGGPEFHTYKGKVAGYENSTVSLTIHRNILFGTIDIEENPYHIEVTRKSIEGKMILALYRQADVIEQNIKPATL
ncbi:hypothetical protein RE474_01335 [Methanolobus sediminis]|uniref:Uncharacterized protein n=1 Tax=Methanolobus sediminis TaxID=3072978 RepID=A0AA51YMA6_9EURY|nr:hypothetical protein [Methanolobus sediminis]WMW25393.1 hypothetical protein RE474_01335 [Methanolobus sediminis]